MSFVQTPRLCLEAITILETVSFYRPIKVGLNAPEIKLNNSGKIQHWGGISILVLTPILPLASLNC